MFSNLHQHTDYSAHDGFAKLPELISRAKELGYPALAITDHGTVTGVIDFYQECKKQGIKPILGCEFYFTREITVQDSPTYHLILLAKDNEGYKNLMKLDTYAHAHFYKKPRIGIEALMQYSKGLVCTTACIAGPLSCDDPLDVANDLYDIFLDDFYIELQPHDFEEQVAYNEQYKAENGFMPDMKRIVTLDSHYVTPDDIAAHKMWLGLGDDSQYYASDDYYLKSEGEVIDWFNAHNIDIKEAIDNVQEIVDKCNVEIEFGGHNYPVFCDDPATYVKEKCNEGFKRLGICKYPNKKEYIAQVRHEFDVLEKLEYLNYFCIIDDMISYCRENNIPTGLGRGSVVGSLTAYLMGITRLDPIKYNLVFERFANPERVTPADIDTDLSTPCRDQVIQYIKEKYGEVYQIRTINVIQDKSAVQRAGQALGIAPTEYTRVSKAIVNVEDMPAKTKEQKEWKALALKFKGHIISYGCHASAVLVSPKDVCNWTAVEKQGDNMVVCHDFHQLEAQGLLKLDILGLETLDVIEQTKHRAGLNFDIANIPTDDKATAEMLRNGNTSGCFQIESNVMTSIVRRMGVNNVEDLSIVVALGRPGPLDSGMVETFLRRRNHQEKTTYEIPELEPILRDTEGVIVYQEQIMQIAQRICGYSLGEADNLRRIIGRKVTEEMQPAIDDMVARGIQNGFSEKQMKSLTDNIITFANYGFNHCLAKDTVIMRDNNGCKALTIEEMFKAKNDRKWAVSNGHRSLWDKYNREGYGYALSIVDGKIKKNKIIDIFYSGTNELYKITLESGKSVICTMLHKFPTPNGVAYMKDLSVGDELYVKGPRILKKYDYRLYGGKESPKNTPIKGQKGFQITGGNYYLYERERELAISGKAPCEVCGKPYDGETRFEMHHVDGDRTNNTVSNLAWVCASCHKKAHYAMGRTRKGENGYSILTEPIVSIEFIGVDDVYDIEMDSPYHTVVVNDGVVVSNSHSAAYGMTAWVTAYLKAHYPAAFMASLLDSNCKDKPKLATYVLHAMNNGIRVLPPQLKHRNCYSDYDEDGPYIILGLNCIAGVGNSEIPKDSPTDFKEFIAQNASLNKTVLSNLVKAGVFEGNRDEMLQYIVWYKDKRKSKGGFKYTKTMYNEHEEESKVLGMSFGDIFEGYDMSLANNVTTFGYEVLNVKGRKTKTGKPMAFVKVRNNTSVKDLVIFNDKYKQIKAHKVYIMRVQNNRIFDFSEARPA